MCTYSLWKLNWKKLYKFLQLIFVYSKSSINSFRCSPLFSKAVVCQILKSSLKMYKAGMSWEHTFSLSILSLSSIELMLYKVVYYLPNLFLTNSFSWSLVIAFDVLCYLIRHNFGNLKGSLLSIPTAILCCSSAREGAKRQRRTYRLASYIQLNMFCWFLP